MMVKLWILFNAFLINMSLVQVSSMPVEDIKAAMHLYKYGYIDLNADTDDVFTTGLKIFQNYAGISETGIVDEETMIAISKKRCGVPDFKTKEPNYWTSRIISYRISRYPIYLNSAIVDREVFKAFELWSKTIDVVFLMTSHTSADIEIQFSDNLESSVDLSYQSDSIIGLSSYPNLFGKIYLRRDLLWTSDMDDGINLLQTVSHQIGHILGLQHTDNDDSIMYPYAKKYNKSFNLSKGDVELAQISYGTPNQNERLCINTSIDAILSKGDEITLFRGLIFWKTFNGSVVEGYPKYISDEWPEINGPIDAIFEDDNGWTYIFQGEIFWKYFGQFLDSKTPYHIKNEFPEGPRYVQAASIFEDQIILFGEDNLYIFEISTSNGRLVKSLTKQVGRVDVAFMHKNITSGAMNIALVRKTKFGLYPVKDLKSIDETFEMQSNNAEFFNC